MLSLRVDTHDDGDNEDRFHKSSGIRTFPRNNAFHILGTASSLGGVGTGAAAGLGRDSFTNSLLYSTHLEDVKNNGFSYHGHHGSKKFDKLLRWLLMWRQSYRNRSLESEFAIYLYMNRTLSQAWVFVAVVSSLVVYAVSNPSRSSPTTYLTIPAILLMILIIVAVHVLGRKKDRYFEQWFLDQQKSIGFNEGQVDPDTSETATDVSGRTVAGGRRLLFSHQEALSETCSAARTNLRRNALHHERVILFVAVACLMSFTGSDAGRANCWFMRDREKIHDACRNNFMFSNSIVYYLFGVIGGMMLRTRYFVPICAVIAIYCPLLRVVPVFSDTTTLAFLISSAILYPLFAVIGAVAMYRVEAWHRDAFYDELRASAMIARMVSLKAQARRLASASVAFDVETLLQPLHATHHVSGTVTSIPVCSSTRAVVCVLGQASFQSWAFAHGPNEIIQQMSTVCQLAHAFSSVIVSAKDAGQWRDDGAYRAFRTAWADEVTVVYFPDEKKPDADGNYVATVRDCFEFAAMCVEAAIQTEEGINELCAAMAVGSVTCNALHDRRRTTQRAGGVTLQFAGSGCSDALRLFQYGKSAIANFQVESKMKERVGAHRSKGESRDRWSEKALLYITTQVSKACDGLEGLMCRDDAKITSSNGHTQQQPDRIRVFRLNDHHECFVRDVDDNSDRRPRVLVAEVADHKASAHSSLQGSVLMLSEGIGTGEPSIALRCGGPSGIDGLAVRVETVISQHSPLLSSIAVTSSAVSHGAFLASTTSPSVNSKDLDRHTRLEIHRSFRMDSHVIVPFRSFTPDSLERAYVAALSSLPTRDWMLRCGTCGVVISCAVLVVLVVDVQYGELFLNAEGTTRLWWSGAMLTVCCCIFAVTAFYHWRITRSECGDIDCKNGTTTKNGARINRGNAAVAAAISNVEVAFHSAAFVVAAICYFVAVSLSPSGTLLSGSRNIWVALALCVSFSVPTFCTPSVFLAVEILFVTALILTQVLAPPDYEPRAVRTQVVQTCVVLFIAIALRLIQDQNLRHTFLLKDKSKQVALLTRLHLERLDRILTSLAPNEALATKLLKSLIKKRALLDTRRSMHNQSTSTSLLFLPDSEAAAAQQRVWDVSRRSHARAATDRETLEAIETQPQDVCCLYFEWIVVSRDDVAASMPSALVSSVAAAVKDVCECFVASGDSGASRGDEHGLICPDPLNKFSTTSVFYSVDPVCASRVVLMTSGAAHLVTAARLLFKKLRMLDDSLRWKCALGFGPIAGGIVGGVCSVPRKNAQAPMMRFDLYGAVTVELRALASMLEWGSCVATRRFVHQLKLELSSPIASVSIFELEKVLVKITRNQTRGRDEEEEARTFSSPSSVSPSQLVEQQLKVMKFRIRNFHVAEAAFVTTWFI